MTAGKYRCTTADDPAYARAVGLVFEAARVPGPEVEFGSDEFVDGHAAVNRLASAIGWSFEIDERYTYRFENGAVLHPGWWLLVVPEEGSWVGFTDEAFRAHFEPVS